MSQNTAYSINIEDNQITLHFHADLIDRASLTRLLDYIQLESIRKSSQLSEIEAVSLADEVNQASWESVKEIFVTK